jgi:hypothetical protein
VSEGESAPENLPALVIHHADEGPDWFAVVTSVGLSLALAPVPGAGAIQKVIETMVELQRNHGSQTVIEIADIVGGGEVVLSRIEEHPELRDLLARTVEAAMRSSYEAKRKLLVRAVANAFQNDEAIDPAIMVERALSRLEPIDVRELARLAAVSDSLGPWPDEERDPGAFHERTGAMVDAGEQIPQPVLVSLVNAGVVLQTTNAFGGGTHLHDVSPLGRDIIRGLQEEGDTFQRPEQQL